jgi:hypothetical protein
MYSDSCIPYDTTQTLWRVINDFDMIARVPFTPATLFNGGAGDGSLMLLSSGVVKVHPSDIVDLASIDVGLLCHRHGSQDFQKQLETTRRMEYRGSGSIPRHHTDIAG